jgi:hypothetical protein
MHCFNRCCTKDSTHRISKNNAIKAFLSWCWDQHCVLVATSLLLAMWVISEASTNLHLILQSSRWLYCISHDRQWRWTPDVWVPKRPHNISPCWITKSKDVTMSTRKQREGQLVKEHHAGMDFTPKMTQVHHWALHDSFGWGCPNVAPSSEQMMASSWA